MHEVCDLVYKLWYSLRQCLCGELRESARSHCRNQMNAKRKLQTSCKCNSRPEIIPVLPSVKAEHGKKKKELSSIYIIPSKLSLIAIKRENASPSLGSGGGWSRAMKVEAQEAGGPAQPRAPQHGRSRAAGMWLTRVVVPGASHPRHSEFN